MRYTNPRTHSLTHGLCLRPNPTRPDPRTKSVHVMVEPTILRPDKVGGLLGEIRVDSTAFVGDRVVKSGVRQSLAGI